MEQNRECSVTVIQSVRSSISLMTLGHGIENEWAQAERARHIWVVQPAGEPEKALGLRLSTSVLDRGSLGLIGESMTRGRPLRPVTIQSGLVSTQR